MLCRFDFMLDMAGFINKAHHPDDGVQNQPLETPKILV
jgi:hypothetical protein